MARIRPYCLAPQGMFTLNADGQVISAVLMFDNVRAVSDFLNFSRAQYEAHSQSSPGWAARRYMRYPSVAAPTIMAGAAPTLSAMCPTNACGLPPRDSGADGLTINVIGRAVEPNGQLCADVLHQEHYGQDQFTLSPDLEQQLFNSVSTAAGASDIPLPSAFGSMLMTHTYLGNLDVQPVAPVRPAQVNIDKCAFYLSRVPGKTNLFRLRGQSHVCTESNNFDFGGDGATFKNDVALSWTGFVQMADRGVKAVWLVARGDEELIWRAPDSPDPSVDEEVQHLPAGRHVAVKTKVIFGLTTQQDSRQIATAPSHAPGQHP